MSNDVAISAALRTNLLSLQNTQSSIDKVQEALATGRKVNSALDNPQSFFAAQSLNSRAGDLSRLLDSIGQSLSTVQAADKGINALTDLLNQADSVAQQAADTLASESTVAKVTGTENLRDLTQLTDLATIEAGDTFDITTTDDSGATITETITIDAGDSIDRIAAEITDQFANNQDGEVTASVTAEGRIQIETTTGRSFRIDNLNFANSGGSTLAENEAAIEQLGLSDAFARENDGAGNQRLAASIVPSDALISTTFRDTSDNSIADASLELDQIVDDNGNALFAGLDNAADDLQISINGEAAVSIDLFGGGAGSDIASIQSVVDQINDDATLSQSIQANYDAETGEFSIRPVSADVQTIQIGVTGNDGTTQANFRFLGATGAIGDVGANGLDLPAAGANAESISYAVGTAANTLATLEQDYNSIRTQIDQLVADSDYRGTNLINGDNLQTFFNEDRSSSLTIEGKTFTSEGLSISEADFGRSVTVTQSISELRTAIEEVRSFGSTLANNQAVLQTRENFTEDLINELEAGADKLTLADPNEEGAKLLALQTRQQLGTTSLSLAAQSQQSVLRLF